jgi:hypothetical protein
MTEAEFKRIKVGVKSLEDAVLDMGNLQKAFPKHGYLDKNTIYRAIAQQDLDEMRNISNFYYNVNGIYQKVCNYLAFLYRYDWYVTPEIYDDAIGEEKVMKDFNRVLSFLDNSYIKKVCGDIALEVIKNGCYYGYIVPCATGLVLQQLPVKYCRTRYSVGGFPVVEFDMSFFDTFSDPSYRLKVLQLFPEDFAKGYMLYKKNKLVSDYPGVAGVSGKNSWYVLDPESAVKFNFNNSDMPTLITTIPALLDLDAAQDLDRKKQM